MMKMCTLKISTVSSLDVLMYVLLQSSKKSAETKVYSATSSIQKETCELTILSLCTEVKLDASLKCLNFTFWQGHRVARK